MSGKSEVHLWEIYWNTFIHFFCRYVYKHFCWCTKCSYYKLPL